MRPFGSSDHLQHRRNRAIVLFTNGLSQVDVAKKLGVDSRSVRRWIARYRKKGSAGIEARPVPGRPTKLDAKGKRKLERLLLRGARDAGFPTDLWTCPRILTVLRRKLGVRYHLHHIPRLLRSLGWSPQKPERRARERNEKEIQRWIKEEWPRIKKKRAN